MYFIYLLYKFGLFVAATEFAPFFFKKDNMLELVAKPAGTSAALKCAASGNPEPKITWIKDGKPVQKGENVCMSILW